MVTSALRQVVALVNSILLLILLAAGCFVLGLGGTVYYRNSLNPFYGISSSNYYVPRPDGEPGVFNPPLIMATAGDHLNTGRIICVKTEAIADAFKALNGFGHAQWVIPQQSTERILPKGCVPRSAPTILPLYGDHFPSPGFYWYEFDFSVTMPAPQKPLIERLMPVLIYLNEPGMPQLNLAQATALMHAHPEMIPPKPASSR